MRPINEAGKILKLNKQSIARLNHIQMVGVMGGVTAPTHPSIEPCVTTTVDIISCRTSRDIGITPSE